MKNNKQKGFSAIVALAYISESELVKVIKNYNSNYELEYPLAFKQTLWELGLDSSQNYTRQDFIRHRNRLGESVLCSRWVGNERQDKGWIESGFASREAIDRDKNNKLLDDIYRARNLTQDAQDRLEYRDRFDKVEETEDD